MPECTINKNIHVCMFKTSDTAIIIKQVQLFSVWWLLYINLMHFYLTETGITLHLSTNFMKQLTLKNS